MSCRRGLLLLGLGLTSAVLAADVEMRPGRWETTVQIEFAGPKPPQEMPFSEPIVTVQCVTADDIKKMNAAFPIPEECQVSEYTRTGRELRFSATCEGVALEYRVTFDSPDSYSGVATSSSKGQKPLTMKVSGRRTADACSAKELKQREEASDDFMSP